MARLVLCCSDGCREVGQHHSAPSHTLIYLFISINVCLYKNTRT